MLPAEQRLSTFLLVVEAVLLSRSRERSKEGQRGCQTSTWGLPPPLDSPRTHNAIFIWSGRSHRSLAGAYRNLVFLMFVGAPLPCTASRRCRDFVCLCSSLL